jgi:hypothetical protein
MDANKKKQVNELLSKNKPVLLAGLCDRDRDIWREVRFRLYDLDERLRWSAIETAGQLMRLWWQRGQEEKVRNYIRTLFWSLTDESGGIGWSSPQTIAETIANIPEIVDPYGSMMIAYTIDEPPLVKGGLWGIGRLGPIITDAVKSFQDTLLTFFNNEDVEILGLLSWAMGEARVKPSLAYQMSLIGREEPAEIYIGGNFRKKPLGQWARDAVSLLKSDR